MASIATATYTLVGDRSDWQVQKCLVTGAFAGVDLRRCDLGMVPAESKAAVNAAKLPVLLLTATSAINQSNAIVRFISRKNPAATLYGKTPEESAMVDQWLDFSQNELETAAAVLTYPVLGVDGASNVSGEATAAASKDVLAALKTLDAHLLDHMYLVNDIISVADIAAATACINHFKLFLTKAHREGLKNVTRWFYTCVNQPSFRKHVGIVPEAPFVGAPSCGGESKVSAPRGPASTSPAVVNVEFNTTLPNGGAWRRDRTRIREIVDREDQGKGLVGQTVCVAGWIKSLQKNLRFLQLGDGSCAANIQVVMEENETDGHTDVKNCGGQDACIRVYGTVQEGRRVENPVEIKATKIVVLGRNTDNQKYPIAKSRKGIQFETLRKSMHLRVRTQMMGCIMRLRNACAYATHRFFQQRGFNYVHTVSFEMGRGFVLYVN